MERLSNARIFLRFEENDGKMYVICNINTYGKIINISLFQIYT